MNQVFEVVSEAVKAIFGSVADFDLTRPEEKFGDYSVNVALRLAAETGESPKDIASKIADFISKKELYASVEVAGPGFINIKLRDPELIEMASGATKLPKTLENKEVLVEYGDPNPFKEMHIGHLYSYIVGDSISKLNEAQGAIVHRLSYHGDVGLHVAKAIWAMRNNKAELENKNIGFFYSQGAKAYEEDLQAKEQIDNINQAIYNRSDAEINELYDWGRQKSFGYFGEVLKTFEIKSDKPYFESQSAPVGLKFVNENTGTVFKNSDGAIIFEGENAGLHTRVFITSKGLPTYEAKDLGLAELKNQDYPDAALSIIITANEQSEYFKVMLAALSGFDPALAAKTRHLSHGFVSLSTGKMSSRTGDVYSAMNLLDDAKAIATKLYPNSTHQMHLAAIKYGFLKHRLGTDIAYDIEESVSIEGNSGPYIQYAHARARGILNKSTSSGEVTDLDPAERSLARKISEYPEVVAKATKEVMPHYICTYLYELSQTFNRFYEDNRVLGSERETGRLLLVSQYADVLKNGLNLLNIDAPEQV